MPQPQHHDDPDTQATLLLAEQVQHLADATFLTALYLLLDSATSTERERHAPVSD